MRGDLGAALAVSLGLHLLLLWPSPPAIDVDDPLPVLMATLRPAAARPEPPALAAPLSPRGGAIRQLPPADPEVAPVALVAAAVPAVQAGIAPSTAAASQNSETSPAARVVAPAAAGAPSSDASAEGLRQYRLALAVEARRHKRYPPRALDAGIGGTAEVRVDLVDGRAAEVTLGRPSGDAALDAAALDMIRKAAPRAAVPESLRRRSFAVSLPIVFDPDE